MKNNKLPKRFKDRWVKALISGKFLQEEGRLESKGISGCDTHCCLGVAGKICGVNNFHDQGVYRQGSVLAEEAVKKGLPKLLVGSNDINQWDYNKLVSKLTNFNDGGKSFEWIAAYIKRYL